MVGTRTGRLTKRVLLQCVMGLVLVQTPGVERPTMSAATESSPVIEVSPGQSIQRECPPREEETLAIVMQQGQSLRFSVLKGDFAVRVETYSPNGTKLVEYVSYGYETIESSLISETSGTYKIVIRSLETAKARRYELRLQSLNALTKNTQLDYEARKMVANATVQRARWKSVALHQAIELYDKAASLWKAEGNLSDAAHALIESGAVCFLLSEYNDALKRYQTAEQLAVTSDDDLTESRAVSRIGLLFSYLGNNDKAQLYLTNALRFLETADERDEGPLLRDALAEALSNLGEVTYSKGNLVRSLAQFERAQKIFADIGDRNGEANVHLFAGYVAGSLGDPPKATAEISMALKLFRETTNKAGEGRALTTLGLASSSKRNEDAAIELHRAALKIFQAIGDRHSEAVALNALGQSYEDLHEYSIALDYYQQALELCQRLGALDLASVAMCKVAAVYRLGANLDQALVHYQRCIDMSRSAGKLRTEAIGLEEVGTIYAAQGQLEQTQRQFQKLQRFYERLKDVRGQVSALNSSGDSFLLLGHPKAALEAYRRALPLSESAGDTGVIISTLYNLARVERDLGLLDAALAHVDQSLERIEEVRRNVGSPDFRASYFSGIRKHYDLRIDILMQLERAHPGKGFSRQAFLTSENARARSLLDLLTETHADLRGTVSPDLLKREKELQLLLQAQARYLLELSLSGRDDRETAEVTAELDRLRSEYLELQSQLNAHAAQRFVEPASVTVEQIQEQLHDPETMLLEFALGETRSYLWVVTRDSFRDYELPPARLLQDKSSEVYKLLTARQDLEKLKGDDYGARIEAADNLYGEKAAQLSEMLLGQISEPLSKSKRLLVVAEGFLQYISFEALPVPNRASDGTQLTNVEQVPFLVTTHEIVRLPSVSTLIAIRNMPRRRASADNIVAVFADPVFGADDERVKKAGGFVTPTPDESTTSAADYALPVDDDVEKNIGPIRLSNTANEASAIVATAPRGTAFVAEGFDASRDKAVSSKIGQFQIVHFATHSFLNSEHPELSGLILSMVDPNGAKQNGLMLLPDIYSLDLSAEVTVLSACDTALGKDLSGEGLMGFTHSFLAAGAKSIVASLWKVDDRATANLMASFYQSMLEKGMPPAAALRAAKLRLMNERQWRAPYYWAGFVFQGEYENHIAVNKSSSPRLIAFLASALLLVVFGVVLSIRRRRKRRLSDSTVVRPERLLT